MHKSKVNQSDEKMHDVRGRRAQATGVFYNQRQGQLLDSAEVRAHFGDKLRGDSDTGTVFQEVSIVYQQKWDASNHYERITGSSPDKENSSSLVLGRCDTENLMKPTDLRKKEDGRSSNLSQSLCEEQLTDKN